MPKQDNLSDLVAKYTRPHTDAVRDLGRSALGSELVNGYTTLDQAVWLTELLALEAGNRLLDLGAGRAWPGVHIAGERGCDLVCTDLTHEAMSEARGVLAESEGVPGSLAVVANGVALPFRAGIFNAVVHADVLC